MILDGDGCYTASEVVKMELGDKAEGLGPFGNQAGKNLASSGPKTNDSLHPSIPKSKQTNKPQNLSIMVQFANEPSKGKSESSSEEIESGGNTPNGTMSSSLKRKSEEVEGNKKRKRKRGLKANGDSNSRRRHSVSKPARDPRDNPSPARPALEVAGTRSPSPVIDFDGLSRPSMLPSPFTWSIYWDVC